MSYRRRKLKMRALADPFGDELDTLTMQVSEWQGVLGRLFLPTGVSGKWDRATAFGTSAILAQVQKDVTATPSGDGRSITFLPRGPIDALLEFDTQVRPLADRVGLPTEGTNGQWMVRMVELRNIVPALAVEMQTLKRAGVLDRETEEAFNRYVDKVEAAWTDVVDEITSNESVKRSIGNVAANLGTSYRAVIDTLSKPLERIDDVSDVQVQLGVSTVVIVVVAVAVIAVAGAVAVAWWKLPAALEAKARQREAETELETVQTAREAIKRGMSAEEIERVFGPVERLRRARPKNGDGFPFGFVLGGAAVIGGGFLLVRFLRRRRRESQREPAVLPS